MLNVGLLLLRLTIGLIVAAHGAQKLFGWWSGPRLDGFAGGLERMGIWPPRAWALIAALSEFGGGLLLATGLLSPLGNFAVIASMTVAIWKVHLSKGFWNTKGGLEFPLSLLAGALALTLTGPGLYSLDHVLRIALPEPWTWIACALGVVAGAAVAVNSGKLLAPLARRLAG